jgi:hypothetical protein
MWAIGTPIYQDNSHVKAQPVQWFLAIENSVGVGDSVGVGAAQSRVKSDCKTSVWFQI